jgi:hypothetical protein
MMETIGLGGWDIDMVRTKAVVSQVRDRYRRLGDLHGLRAQAQPRWEELYAVTASTFQKFAAEVVAYRDLGVTRCERQKR